LCASEIANLDSLGLLPSLGGGVHTISGASDIECR
jgi:hypothetical protein